MTHNCLFANIHLVFLLCLKFMQGNPGQNKVITRILRPYACLLGYHISKVQLLFITELAKPKNDTTMGIDMEANDKELYEFTLNENFRA